MVATAATVWQYPHIQQYSFHFRMVSMGSTQAMYTDVAQARQCLKGLMGQIRLIPNSTGERLDAELRYNSENLLKLALRANFKAGLVTGGRFMINFVRISLDPQEENFIKEYSGVGNGNAIAVA